jgi:hypothetical protein
MKQTAVEWLYEQLEWDDLMHIEYIHKLYSQAKEIEKQQIKDAYLRGIKNYDPTFKNE